MRISDSFIQNGKCFVACSGSDITKDMQISKIKADAVEYNVTRISTSQSFSGHYQAMLEIDSPHMLPNVSITVLS